MRVIDKTKWRKRDVCQQVTNFSGRSDKMGSGSSSLACVEGRPAIERDLYSLQAVNQEQALGEVEWEHYPEWGQGFPLKHTKKLGLLQDCLPRVSWHSVPVSTFDNENGTESGIDGEWKTRVDEIVTNYMKKRGIPGGAQVIILEKGRVQYHRGFGVRCMVDGDCVTKKTMFPFASISKPITASAVMLLVERGSLALSDKVVDLLQSSLPSHQQYSFPPKDPRILEISILQLLSHRAGFSDGQGLGSLSTYMPTAATALQLLWQVDLSHTPGEEFEYTNFAYNLLGRVIEVVSEQSYESFVNENIWSTAGVIEDVGPEIASNYEISARDARMYTPTRPQDKSHSPNEYWKYLFGGKDAGGANRELGMEGAGGWKGCVEDLAWFGHTFLKSLQGNKGALLSQPSANQMIHPVAESDCQLRTWYGLGWHVASSSRGTAGDNAKYISIGHTGSYGAGLFIEVKHQVVWAYCMSAHHNHLEFQSLLRTFVQKELCKCKSVQK